MRKPTSAYWDARAMERMAIVDASSERVMRTVQRAYARVIDDLERDAKKMFQTFRRLNYLSEEEARAYLSMPASAQEQQELIRRFARDWSMGESVDKLTQANAPAYAARISRVEALKRDCQIRLQEAAELQLEACDGALSDVARSAHFKTTFDIQKGLGLFWDTAGVNERAVQEILARNWSGAHYSTRIWRDCDALADKLSQGLVEAMVQGKTSKETFEQIAAACRKGKKEGADVAQRLIQTEACYVANQAEFRAYAECGFDEYEFVATLDTDTSEICRELDGQHFPVREQKPGVNAPPMHPWCRSTTRPRVKDRDLSRVLRWSRGADGNVRYIPANMTYREWEKLQNDGNRQDG